MITKKNRNSWFVFIGLLLMAALVGLAVKYQNAYLLYAASVIPLLIVPLMPDFRSSQKLKPSSRKGIRIYRQTADASAKAEFVIIGFEPGTVKWKKHILYVPIANLPALPPSSGAISLTVLRHDLIPHPRKKNWIGIRLPHLVERSAGMSFALKDANRLTIRAEDLNDAVSRPAKSAASSSGRGLQA